MPRESKMAAQHEQRLAPVEITTREKVLSAISGPEVGRPHELKNLHRDEAILVTSRLFQDHPSVARFMDVFRVNANAQTDPKKTPHLQSHNFPSPYRVPSKEELTDMFKAIDHGVSAYQQLDDNLSGIM